MRRTRGNYVPVKLRACARHAGMGRPQLASSSHPLWGLKSEKQAGRWEYGASRDLGASYIGARPGWFRRSMTTVNVSCQCVPWAIQSARKTRSAASRSRVWALNKAQTSPRDRTGRWAARGAWRRDVLWFNNGMRMWRHRIGKPAGPAQIAGTRIAGPPIYIAI